VIEAELPEITPAMLEAGESVIEDAFYRADCGPMTRPLLLLEPFQLKPKAALRQLLRAKDRRLLGRP